MATKSLLFVCFHYQVLLEHLAYTLVQMAKKIHRAGSMSVAFPDWGDGGGNFTALQVDVSTAELIQDGGQKQPGSSMFPLGS